MGRSSTRRSRRGLIWAGTNDGKLWYTKDGGANVERRQRRTSRTCRAWGTFTQIWPSHVRPGDRLHGGVVPPDGRPQALHLQVDRLRRDVDEDHRQHSDRPSARLRPVVVRQPEQEGDAVRRERRARSTTRWTTAANWTRFKDGLPPAPVSWITVEPRFHDVVDLDVRPRPVHPAEHHAARADGADRPATITTAKVFEPARDRAPGAQRLHAGGRPHFTLFLPTAPSAPIKIEILDGGGKVMRTQDVVGHQGWNGVDWDLRYDGADARRVEDDAAGEPAYLGRAALPGDRHAPDHALGDHAADRRSRWPRQANTRRASRSTARR